MSDLKSWIYSQAPDRQELFFKRAARFFSNRELAAIIDNIQNGCSLYKAHLRSGVLDRYWVDLENIRNNMMS